MLHKCATSLVLWETNGKDTDNSQGYSLMILVTAIAKSLRTDVQTCPVNIQDYLCNYFEMLLF